jgi:NitT/TauT family transport system substrate-binding protein
MAGSLTVSRAALLAGAAATGASAAFPRVARGADLVVVKAASAFQDDVGPLLYGIAAGVFARQGLDVQVEPVSSGAVAAAAVAGGALQFAKSGPISLVTGHARGVPFTIVAPSRISTPEHPVGGLLVRTDSPIKTGKDCNGKIVAGSALADFNALVAMAWIDQNGGDAKTVKLVEIPQSALVAALHENRLDLGTAQNPVLYEALLNKQARLLCNPFDALGNRYIASCWFTTKDLVAKQPDLVRKFVAALKESTRYALAHPLEVAPMLAPFLHEDATRLRKMGIAPVGVDLVAKELQPAVDVAVRYGLIPKGFDAAELITTFN